MYKQMAVSQKRNTIKYLVYMNIYDKCAFLQTTDMLKITL